MIVLGLLVLGLVVVIYLHDKRWRALEDQWRQRERQLIDRLLQRGAIEPLDFQRENVLRLGDEQPQESWWDVAMRDDAILEELEQVKPEARGMTPGEARDAFPQDWKRFEDRFAEERTPLRR